MIGLNRRSQMYSTVSSSTRNPGSSSTKNRRQLSFTGSTPDQVAPISRRGKAYPIVPTVPTVQTNDLSFFDAPKDKLKGPREMKPVEVYEMEDFEPVPVKKMRKKNKHSKTMVEGELPLVGCMPGCTHYHKCNFDQDYSKNFNHPIEARPGYFQEFNEELEQKQIENAGHRGSGPNNVYFATTKQAYDICSYGKKETPINLDTSIKPLSDFKDQNFTVKYRDIDAKKQRKYKESGQ